MTHRFVSNIVMLPLSPTRLIIDLWKGGGTPKEKGDRLRAWSCWLFVTELVGCALLVYINPEHRPLGTGLCAWLLLVYPWSRVNEISYAFYSDALDSKKTTDLTRQERIRMAMRSYFGLAFNFAVAYYFLPLEALFNEPHLSTFREALYYSGVTLATLGYGDIFPIRMVSRGLALYEVFSGILIIAVAIATYAGGTDA
jgi:hypothetical protein